jgi:protein transport protein SEC13
MSLIRAHQIHTDRTVKIYNVSDTSYELSATLQGHQGPVWQVSWAHPKFGVLLASCSFDGSVQIHKEGRAREWALIHAANQLHESSVNGVAFGPHEMGLAVAAASSDGRVSVVTHQPEQQTWSIEYLDVCPMGVNAVSWAPSGAYYNKDAPDAPEMSRLVAAGCDNTIHFWICPEQKGEWKPHTAAVLGKEVAHSDWVRDVAWAPSLVPNVNVVASCSEDGSVIVWKQQDGDASVWEPTLLHTFDAPVWRVSWSVTGHLLAVSSGDSNVTLWKAELDGVWSKVSSVEQEEGTTAVALPQA